MDYSIVCEKEYLETANRFAKTLGGKVLLFGEDLELNKNVVLIFKAKLGRVSSDVMSLNQHLIDKNVAIFCNSNTGFDIGRLYKNMLKKQSSILVYSRYYNNLDVAKSCIELQSKIVRIDGNSLSEKFAGAICRLIFGANT